MRLAGRGEGGAALRQRRRGLPDGGLPLLPKPVNHVLHRAARHLGVPSAQRSLSGIRSAIFAREAGAGKGSAKYWVSCAT